MYIRLDLLILALEEICGPSRPLFLRRRSVQPETNSIFISNKPAMSQCLMLMYDLDKQKIIACNKEWKAKLDQLTDKNSEFFKILDIKYPYLMRDGDFAFTAPLVDPEISDMQFVARHTPELLWDGIQNGPE